MDTHLCNPFTAHLHPEDFVYTVLCLDFDETIGSFGYTFLNKKYTFTKLSSSAEDELDSSDRGMYVTEKRFENTKAQMACGVFSIARQEFKDRLDRIYEIIKVFGKKSPIAVKIITTSLHQEAKIKEIFDQFFADGDQRFSKNLFPIEFFNRYSFVKNGQALDPTKIDKGQLMARNFEYWKQDFRQSSSNPLPDLIKQDVHLFDNMQKRINEATSWGFSAAHFPTTPQHREVDARFSLEKDKFFDHFNHIIDRALGIKKAAQRLPQFFLTIQV